MHEERETAHRLAAYSDAVFAVIVTIMVLELRAPEQAAFSALWPLWPTAISYAVSYLFIAIIWMERARCRKLRRERGKRRQDCQYPRHHQVAFVRENDLFFAADPKYFTIETPGLGRFLRDHAVRWIPVTPVQSRPLLTPNF
jgi:hypothetical protein